MIARLSLMLLVVVSAVMFVFPGASASASNSSAPVEAVAAAIKCPSVYIVRYGETLSSIAARCGISATTLKQANGLRSTRVWPGQRLFIPSPKPVPTPYLHRPPSP